MRLFIGIPLEKKLVNEIYSLYNKFKNLKNAKFVKKENLHITLKFLGEVEEEKITLIKNAIVICETNFFSSFLNPIFSRYVSRLLKRNSIFSEFL